MKLTEIVSEGAIIPSLETDNRDEVISQLVGSLKSAGKLDGIDSDEVVKAVISRENEASTGIGKGVAVPHVKYAGIKEVVAAIGLSESGVDFSSLDKQPVYSVILLVSPADNPDKHLQAMETVFKHLQDEDFRSFLRQSQDSGSVFELLREYDEKSAD